MAITLKILAGLLVLMVLGVTIALTPAHLQVRQMSSVPKPDEETLLALKVDDGPVSLSYLKTSSQNLPVGTLAHSVFLLEWQDGRLLMIDAGMREQQALAFGKPLEMALGAEPAVFHEPVAELLGDAIDRVAAVGFTHLHIDHTEGVLAFCKKRAKDVLLLQTEQQAGEHNFGTSEGAGILANTCLNSSTVGANSMAGHEAFPGLGMFPAGGHTPGSTIFAFWIGDRLTLLSGDITNTKNEIVADLGKGFLYSYLVVPEDTARTAELRQWLKALNQRPDAVVIVSHDLGDIAASGIAVFKP